MMRYLMLCLLMVCGMAQASELDGVLGVGIGKNVISHQPFERMGSLGVQYGSSWVVRASGGYWMATADGDKSSLYGSMQGGLQVWGEGGTYANMLFGPALISNPDDYHNSGIFQFNLSAAVGIKSVNAYGITVEWRHWSNAGMIMPNAGRDILTACILIPLWRSKL